jgi:hypothetical protein
VANMRIRGAGRILSCCMLLTMGAASLAYGATYYVDFAGGSDTNSGTTATYAFKHCPGDDAATGVAAGVPLSGGDTVVFRGGVRYLGRVDLNWSGQSGARITYDGNAGGSWGTGKALLDGENMDTDARRYGFYASSSRSYITIRGFEFTRLGGHASISWNCSSAPAAVAGYGIYLSSCTDITVENCYFHDIGDWQNAPGMSLSLMEGWGVFVFRSAARILVDGCEFTRVPIGIVLDARSDTIRDIEITRCDIHHNVRWGIDLVTNANNSTLRGIDIHHNSIRDVWQYAANSWLGCSGTNPHYDGIILRIGGAPYTGQQLGTLGEPIRIRANRFYNDDSAATDAGTAMIFLTTFGGTVLIYNNLFVNTLSNGYGAIYAQDGTSAAEGNPQPDYHIYNNSFMDARKAVTLRTLTTAWALTNGNIRIKNNVFFNTSSTGNYMVECGLDGNSQPDELDYNRYVTGRSDQKVASMFSGTRVYWTLSELRSAGFEKNGSYGNPLFTNTTYGLGSSSGLNDLSLRTDSPCVNAGVDLSAFFSDDFSGVSRPQGSAWDVGAFELPGGGAQSPGKPANLRIKGQ